MEAGRALSRLGPDAPLTPKERGFLGPTDRDTTLAELDQLDTPHERRATIGVRLAFLVDERRAVGVRDGVPDIAWCEIPAGEVDLELTSVEERSAVRRFMKTLRAGTHSRVQPFAIAKFPATSGQYRAFSEAEDGYRDGRWWYGLHREAEPGRQQVRRANHPATDVSWFDALAFCRWLSLRLGYEVRLPTEWAWQQAAIGGDPYMVYPWGRVWDGMRANTCEAGLGRTTAVGLYPGGASDQGVLDLAGGVWESCLNKYDRPEDTAVGGDDPRVLRGGSWLGNRGLTRAAVRRVINPGYRIDSFGFRVCRSSQT